jgi:iron complex outermembrane recepter protein
LRSFNDKGTCIVKRLILTMLAATPLWAMAEAKKDDGLIEEIVVTATHRATRLMDTPLSVSAVSAEVIEQLGAVDMQSLFKNIAGLNMDEGASAGSNRYVIRGITSQTGGSYAYSQTSPAVSVYLDGVPMTSAQGSTFQFGGNLFDVARVEVLKGPQGTLFGEGSVGGTIRFIQNKPRLDEFDYKVKAGVNSCTSRTTWARGWTPW